MPQKDPGRTERPTPRRIRQAREKGNVPKSQEMGTTMTMLVGVMVTFAWINFMGRELMSLFRHYFGPVVISFDPTPGNTYAMFLTLTLSLAKIILPIMLVVALGAFLIQRLQVGKLWTWTPLKPDLKKLNPLSGIRRMFFSLQTFTRLGKSLLKAVFIGFAPVLAVRNEIPNFITLYYADAAGLSAYILGTGFKVTLYALVPMIILAVIDLVYTRWDYIEQLKMTKSEIKDEQRQAEGDPQIKSRLRQKMLQIGRRRMLKEVPRADVVITNPTHLAVALKYEAGEAPAPIVVAKGADRVAEKIKEIARAHHVPIRENKPLARALFRQTEVGEMIPEDLYQAVAAILAQLWKQKGASRTQ
ncbi:MAG: flagellar biosynthesis protein FlhB [Deltaproteobacteria bacterium]|jgi:flagellar biosynthetic protein FlhB|nr:flagellar biosynthesis protein FlhB [Deltaproteobacteria bacterium]